MTRRRPLIVLAIIAILLVTPFLLRNPPLGETNSTSATTLVLDKNITFYPYLDMARGRASIEMLSRILAEAKQQLLANNLSVAGPRAGLVRGLILHGRLVNDFVLDIRGKLFYFVVLAAKHGNSSVTNSNAFLGPLGRGLNCSESRKGRHRSRHKCCSLVMWDNTTNNSQVHVWTGILKARSDRRDDMHG